ncbi:hypothetical protein [Fuchsiella alkaliacetigena]|uniref:hypothetical protein n=1 Tax=Fuchsiella alkaliacetigena TaxID=957042 RepID=UPI00200B8453|nr:hypothetical protein [Fuchsiella alkaliacetigena]MCK8824556.1 hypothetical protein [Fuchsiella alkaliacetigena]
MELKIIQLITMGLLEVFLMTYVGLGLLGIKTTIVRHLQIGVIYVLGIWITRNLLQLYGLHTLLLCILLIVLIKFIVKIDWQIAIIAVLLGFVILFIGEAIFLQIVIRYLNVNMEKFVTKSSPLFLILHIITHFFLLFSAVLVKFFEIKIINLAGEENDKI